MMEEQLSLAAKDKSRAVAEVEQKMTTEIVKQQVRNLCVYSGWDSIGG